MRLSLILLQADVEQHKYYAGETQFGVAPGAPISVQAAGLKDVDAMRVDGPPGAAHSHVSVTVSLGHCLSVTCTCCCDGIYGAQDLKISHANSLILSFQLMPGLARLLANVVI